MARLLVFVVVGLALSCGTLRSAPPDGGPGGGSPGGAGGGGTAGGGAAGGGGSTGGGGGAGGLGGGAGQYQRADAGTFALQDISPVTGSDQKYDQVFGLSLTDVVITDSYGQVQHFDGSQWTVWYQTPTSVRFEGLYVAPSGAVFAAAEDTLYWCLANCSQPASWRTAVQGGKALHGLCGRGSTVYAVGDTVANGQGLALLFNSAAGTWGLVAGAKLADHYRDCALASDGTLHIAAQRYAVRVSPGLTDKTDLLAGEPAPILLEQWNAVSMMGEQVVMVGDEKRIARRSASAQWTVLLRAPANDFQSWSTVASTRADEALIGGGEGVVGPLARVDTGAVVTLLPDPAGFYVSDVWGANDVTWFLVGTTTDGVGGSGHGIVYRATR